MMHYSKYCMIAVAALFLAACNGKNEEVPLKKAYVESLTLDTQKIAEGGKIYDAPVENGVIEIVFSAAVDLSKFNADKVVLSGGATYTAESVVDNTLSLTIASTLKYDTTYTLTIRSGENLGLSLIDSYTYKFVTVTDPSPKFPTITDDELLTKVQQQTFAYFWDYAHPVSGLARERLGSGDTVTSGGSGFGIMTIPMAIERGFITRAEGLARMTTIVDFLADKAERFHGAYSHWLNGSTGKAIAFGTKDNGGDLVETALLIQGLLAVAEYFDGTSAEEQQLVSRINEIWRGVEWTWYTQDSQRLYWHWSPDHEFEMNMSISGWNEALIVYVLAASSPTCPISKSVYDNGWAGNGSMRNGNVYYGFELPLGSALGGPMFFAHYSFMGLDPRNLSDAYADYWQQNVAHAKINHAYCAANPKKYRGYSAECWGLTASDINGGYTASSPTNDNGTIAPTAALASMPYTPEESLAALHYFYYTLGDKLWGKYGFYDAFDRTENWTASSYIAIDQGPIAVMIENYRTGLLWDLFMRNEDIQNGLSKLGFTY